VKSHQFRRGNLFSLTAIAPDELSGGGVGQRWRAEHMAVAKIRQCEFVSAAHFVKLTPDHDHKLDSASNFTAFLLSNRRRSLYHPAVIA